VGGEEGSLIAPELLAAEAQGEWRLTIQSTVSAAMIFALQPLPEAVLSNRGHGLDRAASKSFCTV